MRAQRFSALLALALAASTTGCRTKDCRDGTVLVALTLQGAAASADALQVEVAVDDGMPNVSNVAPHGVGSGNLEVTFSHFPAGHTVTVTVVAQSGGNEVGRQSTTVSVAHACEHIALVVGTGDEGDMAGMGDGGGDAACTPTVASCPATACGSVDNGCGGLIACDNKCVVTSLAPTLANTGETIVLEGTFSTSDSTTVDFPGAAARAATVLGTGRATIAVPAGATAGGLIIHTGHSDFGPFYFRRASYPLGPPDSTLNDPNSDIYKPSGALQHGRLNHATVNVNERIYAIGGLNCTVCQATPRADVEEIDISVDGSIARTTVLAQMLTLPRAYHTANVIGGAVYVMGGWANVAPFDSIERAPINADGTLGAFSSVGQPKLSTPRYGHTATIIGSWLYVIGGRANPAGAGIADFAGVERAPINPDGTLGAFANYPAATLIQARLGHAVVATANKLYVIGGNAANSAIKSIEVAPIAPDGTLGAFAAAPTALGVGSIYLNAVQLGQTVIAIADFTFEQATIGSDGTLGSFTKVTAVPAAKHRLGERANVVRDYVFTTGGAFAQPAETVILRGNVNSTGDVGAFVFDSQHHLAASRSGAVSFVVDNHVYVVGGDQTGTVELGTFAADDSFSGFAAYPAAGTLANGRPGASGFLVVNASPPSQLYVTGNASNASDNSVDVADLDANGKLGPFSATAPTRLPLARWGGHAYGQCILGGDITVSMDCFAGNTWTLTDSILKANRTSFAFIYSGGKAWAIGGALSDSVESGPVAPGSAFTATTLTTASHSSQATAVALGHYTYLVGGAADGSLARTDLTAAAPANFATYAGAKLQNVRNSPGAAVIGNQLFVFGGGLVSVEAAPLQ